MLHTLSNASETQHSIDVQSVLYKGAVCWDRDRQQAVKEISSNVEKNSNTVYDI